MTTAAEMAQLYREAEASVLKGQSVRMGDRSLTKADLSEIRAGRREWDALAALEGRGNRSRFVSADFRSGCGE